MFYWPAALVLILVTGSDRSWTRTGMTGASLSYRSPLWYAAFPMAYDDDCIQKSCKKEMLVDKASWNDIRLRNRSRFTDFISFIFFSSEYKIRSVYIKTYTKKCNLILNLSGQVSKISKAWCLVQADSLTVQFDHWWAHFLHFNANSELIYSSIKRPVFTYFLLQFMYMSVSPFLNIKHFLSFISACKNLITFITSKTLYYSEKFLDK